MHCVKINPKSKFSKIVIPDCMTLNYELLDIIISGFWKRRAVHNEAKRREFLKELLSLARAVFYYCNRVSTRYINFYVSAFYCMLGMREVDWCSCPQEMDITTIPDECLDDVASAMDTVLVTKDAYWFNFVQFESLLVALGMEQNDALIMAYLAGDSCTAAKTSVASMLNGFLNWICEDFELSATQEQQLLEIRAGIKDMRKLILKKNAWRQAATIGDTRASIIAKISNLSMS